MLDTALHPPAPGAAPSVRHRLRFTGSGKEYFRIWIVNLFLTIATLGVYSAWAKVRRVRYFDRNTHLAGAVFDFDGRPLAILRGRILALGLLVAYHYAYGFSLAVGCALAGLLVVLLPALLRGALRFRLHHTRYRGLRFGFAGSLAAAYATYAPPLAVLLLPGMLAALKVDPLWAAAGLLPYLAWPWLYGRAKRYQHRHLAYGTRASAFEVPARRFYRPYLAAVGWSLLGLAVSTALLTLALVGLKHGVGLSDGRTGATLGGLLGGLLFGYLAYLVTGPYLQARITNLCWSGTRFPGVALRSAVPAGGFVRLQTANAVLTLLTLGLYRPFAAVRAYQYRLAHVEVLVDGDIDAVLAAAGARDASAGGDGAADFFGIDLAW